MFESLGIPGLFDVHTHFLPPRVAAKVRAQFDTAGPLIGRPWPLHYRDTDEVLVETLRGLGVRHFSALAYAHRPGMAEFLNEWTAGFADRVPEALRSATFYPEDDVVTYIGKRLAAGTEIFKVHVQVGGFDVGDPALDEAWGLIEDAGTPVVLHAGSGPVGTAFTGPGPVAALLPRLADLRDKVLLGSDFPNIPYPYAHQLEALERLGLGDDWLRAVLWENGLRLFGPFPDKSTP